MGEAFRILGARHADALLGPRTKTAYAFLFAGPRGFEPRSTVLETVILPLNYRPNYCVKRRSECVESPLYYNRQ